MKKVWLTYIFVFLGGMLCFQLISAHTVNEWTADTEQSCHQNDDAEESETRVNADDEIIVETFRSPYLLGEFKDCFYLMPGRPLPYISISLHFPPPNMA